MRKMCEKLPMDPVVNLYLLLAGYSTQSPERPGRLCVIWDRPKPPKIEYNRVTEIFTLPRRMGLEVRLTQMVNRQAPLAEIAAVARAGMEKLASQDQYLGPPYRFVTITAAGVAAA
jgi:hypothetical protein